MGSPPHVRGKEIEYSIDVTYTRITPACAGKSGGGCVGTCRAKDHPRMCGEKMLLLCCRCGTVGSPPHVRGKELQLDDPESGDRITPACAGKSQVRGKTCGLHRDHPRMCGEKCIRSAAPTVHLGSPPHVRGKVHCSCARCTFTRITPACAGKRCRP